MKTETPPRSCLCFCCEWLHHVFQSQTQRVKWLTCREDAGGNDHFRTEQRSRPQHWRDNLGTVSWSCVSDFQFLLNVLCLCSCSYSVFVVLIVSYVVGLFLCSLLLVCVCLVSHVYFLPVSRSCVSFSVSVFASCLLCRVHRAGLYFLCLVGQILLTCVPWCVSSPWLWSLIVLFFLISLTGFQLVWCWYNDENLVQGLLSFLCWYTSRCHVICCRFAKARKAMSISESRCVFTIISAVRLSCKQWPEAEAEMLVLSSLFFLWQDVSKLIETLEAFHEETS